MGDLGAAGAARSDATEISRAEDRAGRNVPEVDVAPCARGHVIGHVRPSAPLARRGAVNFNARPSTRDFYRRRTKKQAGGLPRAGAQQAAKDKS